MQEMLVLLAVAFSVNVYVWMEPEVNAAAVPPRRAILFHDCPCVCSVKVNRNRLYRERWNSVGAVWRFWNSLSCYGYWTSSEIWDGPVEYVCLPRE